MGYTHYYRKKEIEHDQKTWDAFVADVKRITSTTTILGDGMGEGGKAEYNNKVICFNGKGSDSHETLLIERSHSLTMKSPNFGEYAQSNWKESKVIFGFTKTAQKPYDLYVTATLVLYKHYFKDKVEVSGDGGAEGFEEGLWLVNSTLDHKIKLEDICKED